MKKLFKKKKPASDALDTVTISITDEAIDAYLKETNELAKVQIIANALESFRQNPGLSLPYKTGQKKFGHSVTITIDKI